MNSSRQKLFLFAVALALIGSAAGAVMFLKAHQRLGAPGIRAVPVPHSVTLQIALPERVLDFTSTNVPEAQVVLDYLPKDTSFAQRHYSAPDGAWAIGNVVLMGADRTSIHRPNYCLPGQGWQVRDQTEVKLTIAGAPPYELPVMKWIVSRNYSAPDGSQQSVSGIYTFWFVTEHQTTDSFPAMLKSMLFHQLAHGVLQRWAYVSYFTVCRPGAEDATFARMKSLIAASVPDFQLPPAPAK
ncbi:MAG TPA: exosortase-associated EpsI family protein [Verrucomicrobiae bacterium]